MTDTQIDLISPLEVICPVCTNDGRWHLQHPDQMANCLRVMQARQRLAERDLCRKCGVGDDARLGDVKSKWATAETHNVEPGMYHDQCFWDAVEALKPRVVDVHIIRPGHRLNGDSVHQATAMAEMDNGELVDVLSWYSDELFFMPEDFMGKTQAQINEMFHKRDIAYLQS